MPIIDIHSVTSVKIKHGEYREVFPEYYQLQGVIENSSWHDHQDVFDHVVRVFENLEIELSQVTENQRTYLQAQVGSHNREGILKIATLLHDIAKKETLITAPNGQANCPGHEHTAVGKVKHFVPLFGLDTLSLGYVERVVLHHGYISEMLFQANSKPENEAKIWALFAETVGDIQVELLLLMKADLQGCDLNKTMPEDYQQKLDQLEKWLTTRP